METQDLHVIPAANLPPEISAGIQRDLAAITPVLNSVYARLSEFGYNWMTYRTTSCQVAFIGADVKVDIG